LSIYLVFSSTNDESDYVDEEDVALGHIIVVAVGKADAVVVVEAEVEVFNVYLNR
jgi:hypothetical protein